MAIARLGSFRTWPTASLIRIQLTSDGHKAYLEAVEGAFGAETEKARLVKI